MEEELFYEVSVVVVVVVLGFERRELGWVYDFCFGYLGLV